MAAADRHSGKEVFLSYTPTAGSEIVLDTDYRNFTYSQELNEIDGTAGDDDWEYMLDSFKRGEATVSILAGLSTAYLNPGSVGNLIYGPKGSTAGLRKVTIPVKLMNVEETAGYADVVTLDLTFRQTGDATVGTWSA
jgi:hypothetical protein